MQYGDGVLAQWVKGTFSLGWVNGRDVKLTIITSNAEVKNDGAILLVSHKKSKAIPVTDHGGS
jgi:hypothetical protein